MRKGWLLAILGVVAVLLAAAIVWVLLIMPAPERTAESPSPTASAETTTPTPTPTPTATPTPAALAAPTCENIMREGFLSPEFAHWVPTTVGDPEPIFADGVVCVWSADPEVGTDNVLAYGWAPIDGAAWDAFTATYTAEDPAWFLEVGDRGQYLTHKTDYWIQDENGYGATYLFTGDAILYALTKAETEDVVGPPAA